MHNLFLFAFVTLLIGACTSVSERSEAGSADSTSTPAPQAAFSWPDNSVYFKANGTEPFWGVQLTPQSVVFSEPGEEDIREIVFPRNEPVRGQEANAVLYDAHSVAGQLQVRILRRTCFNGMSGDSFPYLVNVTLKRPTDANAVKLEGCGEYIPDERLHDIWVLEKIAGTEVSKKDFQTELPYMEINTKAGTFMGYTGCNQMTGSIIFEYDILHFTNIISTHKACPDGTKEDAFLQALKASARYAIGENRLYLFHQERETLTFKHVD